MSFSTARAHWCAIWLLAAKSLSSPAEAEPLGGYWQSLWPRGALVLLLGAVAATVMGLQQRALRRKNQELAALVEARTGELREAQAKVAKLEKAASEQPIAGGFGHEMRNALSGAKMLLGAALGERGKSLAAQNGETLKELFLLLKPHIPADDRQAVAALLKKVNSNDEQIDVILQDVDAALARAVSITQLIMEYARAGRERPGNTPVRVRPLCDAIVAESRDDLAAHDIKVEISMEPRATLHAKESHVYSILKNLLVNARDALIDKEGEGGRVIRISLVEEAERRVLRVEDTGVGIPREHLGKLFEPFFTTKSRRSGTGLGLGVVHKLVTLYEGTIDVESEVGRGTTFVIHLPRLEQRQRRSV